MILTGYCTISRETLPKFFSSFEGDYADFAEEMSVLDPHAVFPTNIYRQCDGYTVSTKDCSTIESVMSTTLTTTIKINRYKGCQQQLGPQAVWNGAHLGAMSGGTQYVASIWSAQEGMKVEYPNTVNICVKLYINIYGISSAA